MTKGGRSQDEEDTSWNGQMIICGELNAKSKRKSFEERGVDVNVMLGGIHWGKLVASEKADGSVRTGREWNENGGSQDDAEPWQSWIRGERDSSGKLCVATDT